MLRRCRVTERCATYAPPFREFTISWQKWLCPQPTPQSLGLYYFRILWLWGWKALWLHSFRILWVHGPNILWVCVSKVLWFLVPRGDLKCQTLACFSPNHFPLLLGIQIVFPASLVVRYGHGAEFWPRKVESDTGHCQAPPESSMPFLFPSPDWRECIPRTCQREEPRYGRSLDPWMSMWNIVQPGAWTGTELLLW